MSTTNSEPLGIETKLWAAADKLRGNIDASEYKHVVLGLVFLKYVSDSFEARRTYLEKAVAEETSEYYIKNPDRRSPFVEDRDLYTAVNVFWIPQDARWTVIQSHAKQPDIGVTIDKAMDLIERENAQLKGILPKNYGRPELDPRRLGELIDLIGSIGFGSNQHEGKDILGRVYEYFLNRFADAEGRRGGEYYTPRPVVRLLVEMLEPYEGRVYDPCCGSGGMFVQSAEFAQAHGGNGNRISVYGQELNATTWRLAKMNLAIHGIEANLGDQSADTFHRDKHPDLRADYILANPPFNISDWGGDLLRDDPRWKFGVPPPGNANYGWVQHMIHHLAPSGVAGFVLANGSLSSQQSGEGEIRGKLIESDHVDCIVALPNQLFYTTQIPVCLWFVARDRSDGRFRDRRGEVLFIDARKLGEMVDRTHRVLTDEDIARIADTYHAWRNSEGGYSDVVGFCKSAGFGEIREHAHILTPGRYVGVDDDDADDEPLEDRLNHLTDLLAEQFARGVELEENVRNQLKKVGYEI